MGLLDDPEAMNKLLQSPLVQAGLGMLAGNRGQYAMQNALAGGAQGLQQSGEYNQQAQVNAYRKQQFEWQKADHELNQKKYAQEQENNKMIYSALGFTPQQTPNQSTGNTPNNFAQNQPQELNRDAIRKLGLITSLNGGHGGDALMKYAESQKPNWQNVGGKFVDANQYQSEIPISPAPMSQAEKIKMQYEGMLPPDNAPQPTQQQPSNPMAAGLPLASQRKVAEAQALQQVQDNSPKAQAERTKIENENRLAGEKRQRGLEGQKAQANVIIGKVDEALGKVNGWSTGFVGQKLREYGNTDAYDLNSAVGTVKANLGFQELQAMRENSPTGGALGAIAVQELQALQSTIASLDTAQSQDQLKNNLAQIKTHYQNVIDTMDGKTPKGYGNVMPSNEKMPTSQPVKKSAMKGQISKGYKFLGGDPSNSANWIKQ